MTTDFRAALAEADEPAAPEVVGPEWQPCVKLPITVHVREQRLGEQHVSTREGITPVRPDDLIMRGVAGEEYPIGRELFQRTYRMGSSDEPAVPEGREPASVVGEPSDEELLELAEDWPCTTGERHDLSGCPEVPLFSVFEDELVEFARAVLARWGHQPAPLPAGEQRHPMPMLLSERLPGPEDCDAEGRCWWSGAQGHHWELCRGFRGAAHWLPAHALPLPAGEVE